MKLAIFSDVHSNPEAFRAVVDDIEGHGVEKMYMLGDLVGYGDPGKCLDIWDNLGDSITSVKGNHDQSVYLGIKDGLDAESFTESIREFNDMAQAGAGCSVESIRGTGHEETFLKYYRGSRYTKRMKIAGKKAILSHGNPVFPELFDYLVANNPDYINYTFMFMKDKSNGLDVSFIGHSHAPFYAEDESDEYGNAPVITTSGLYMPPFSGELKKGHRYIINVGSVGQPRDGDPRACWVLVDDSYLTLKRTEYDIEAARKGLMKTSMASPEKDMLSIRIAAGR